MATSFKYQAKDLSGKTLSGTLSAESQEHALEDLRRRRLVPIEVKAAGGFFAALRQPKKKRVANKASVKKGELEIFTRQLSTMLGAGIPMLEALEILADQAESPGFTYCLNRIVEDIRGGSDLSKAMEAHKRVYSDIYVSMIRAGEVSGQIDTILTRLAEYLEAAAHLRQEIKSAMTYPVVSLFLVFAIAGFLMIYIVPSFKPVFDGLQMELPGLTQVVMDTAMFMRDHWYLFLLSPVALIMGLKCWKKTSSGSRIMDRVMLTAPVFGPLFKKVALSRFARTFSTLIKSGVPIISAMEIVSETAGNSMISNVVDSARDSVRQGESLAEPFGKSPVFPPMVVKMMAIGERSGALDSLLEKISEFYDQQVEAEVAGLTSLIEPIMIGIMGFVVGGIVLAVFLPIMKIQEKLSGG